MDIAKSNVLKEREWNWKWRTQKRFSSFSTKAWWLHEEFSMTNFLPSFKNFLHLLISMRREGVLWLDGNKWNWMKFSFYLKSLTLMFSSESPFLSMRERKRGKKLMKAVNNFSISFEIILNAVYMCMVIDHNVHAWSLLISIPQSRKKLFWLNKIAVTLWCNLWYWKCFFALTCFQQSWDSKELWWWHVGKLKNNQPTLMDC